MGATLIFCLIPITYNPRDFSIGLRAPLRLCLVTLIAGRKLTGRPVGEHQVQNTRACYHRPPRFRRDYGKKSLISHADWDNPKDEAKAEVPLRWARETFKALEPFTNGFYVNTIAAEDTQQRVRATYGDNYSSLVKLKDEYDPTNLFRRNANISPSSA